MCGRGISRIRQARKIKKKKKNEILTELANVADKKTTQYNTIFYALAH